MPRFSTSLSALLALVAVLLYVTFSLSTSQRMASFQAKTSEADLGMFTNSEVLKQVERIREVATSTRPALASDRTAWAMAWLHLVIWDSWRSTYYYADHHDSADFASYRDYALLSLNFLVEHHDAEETTLFPDLEKKFPGSMAHNHEQHESFLAELGSLVKYANATKAENGGSKFNPTDFKQQLDNILLPVMTHLADELESLEGSKLREHYSEQEMTEINARSHAAQKKSAPLALPFVLQNLPPGSPFPPAPGFVKNILGPWVFYWKHRALWKYTAYRW